MYFRYQGLGHYTSKCPNKRIMILRYDGEIESTSDESEYESMTTLENASNVEYVVNGEFFVIRRYLNVQVSKEDVKHQRKNIFHT
jgi:hypothetical protein